MKLFIAHGSWKCWGKNLYLPLGSQLINALVFLILFIVDEVLDRAQDADGQDVTYRFSSKWPPTGEINPLFPSTDLPLVSSIH